MSHEQRKKQSGRLNRRAALRAGAKVGAVGAGLAVGVTGTGRGPAIAAAQPASPWRMEHLELPRASNTSVSIVRAGSGPPQRGDTYYNDAPIFALDDIGGAPIGTYVCFGVWTRASTDTGEFDLRLTTIQWRLSDGTITGLINEGGTDPATGQTGNNHHLGTVQGGTGRFLGALGMFRQLTQPGGGSRDVLDLILPNTGGG
jgi:hypothetical protein